MKPFLKSCSKTRLVEVAAHFGIDSSGSKEDLEARLQSLPEVQFLELLRQSRIKVSTDMLYGTIDLSGRKMRKSDFSAFTLTHDIFARVIYSSSTVWPRHSSE